ncbi:MAG TPA: hypothetical protein VEV17_08055 [Bryobacteraceae bacterium]|nr:hypothetical protein [Bryobacteraceae bacterium]
MHFRHFAFAGGLAVALTLAQGRLAAQAQPLRAETKAARANWTPSRTVDGQPDLQGVWANNNATPMERPKELAGREFLTDAEVAAMKKKAAELFDGSGDAEFGDAIFTAVFNAIKAKGPESGSYKKAENGFDGKTGDYSSVWLVSRDWDNRTSLITDPRDGRLPPMTPEAQKKQTEALASMTKIPAGPEDRGLSERCITFGSPRLGAGYNSYYQIVQSRDTVAIEMETIHDTRLIPLDGRPHLPSNIQTWLGDSRGHWEGDTLVVDTTNYLPNAFMPGSSDKLHIIERFTRTGPERIKYEVTVDDPATWTKPWTAMIPLSHSRDAIYEYACHEGNRGMVGILKGARAEEKAAAESAAK